MDRRVRVGLVVAAIAVVVIAAVIAVAYKAGQSAGRSTPAKATANSSSSPAKSPEAAGGIPKGAAIVGAGGRTKGPAGLPIGYLHDQTGAVEAATNYFIWGSSPRIASKAAPAMAQAMAGSESTRKTLLQRWKILVESGATTADSVSNYDPTRGAYAVRSYTGNAAEIYIFARLSVAANQHQPPDTTWPINAVSVIWSGGDWKLANPLDAESTGPIDVQVDTPTPAEKASLLHAPPKDPGDLPDTAAQNWMEYENAAR